MKKKEKLDYGVRLSGEEYDRAIVALHSNLPPVPSREQQREVRRKELNLTIDYRLGRDFPSSRREALWHVQQKLEKRRLGLMLKYLLRRFFSKRLIQEAQGLAGYVIDAYATVLNKAELEQFFGKEEVRHPGLPVEPEQLKK